MSQFAARQSEDSALECLAERGYAVMHGPEVFPNDSTGGRP